MTDTLNRRDEALAKVQEFTALSMKSEDARNEALVEAAEAYTDQEIAKVQRGNVELFNATNEKIDLLRHDMNKRFDKLEDRFDKLEDRFDKLEDRFDKLEDRFDKLEDSMELIMRHLGIEPKA